jgi:hypothetical protein
LTETVANGLGYGSQTLAGFFHDYFKTSTPAAPDLHTMVRQIDSSTYALRLHG